MQYTMATRRDNTGSPLSCQCSPEDETHGSEITDCETIANVYTTDYGLENTELIRVHMRLAFAEKRITDLRAECVKEYKQAEEEKKRANRSERPMNLAGLAESSTMRKQM
jgi:hypothetical protein